MSGRRNQRTNAGLEYATKERMLSRRTELLGSWNAKWETSLGDLLFHVKASCRLDRLQEVVSDNKAAKCDRHDRDPAKLSSAEIAGYEGSEDQLRNPPRCPKYAD